VDDEWPAMSNHQADSPRTDALVGQLLTEFRAVHIQTPEEGTFYTESVKRVYDLADARRQRLDANGNQLPSVLWIVLIAGGVITVGFTYFFGVSHFASHVLMVAALASMIALTLFLVVSLDLPFSGNLRVGPHAMEHAIGEFAHL
jgi:predicted anti-sigma-YlaC factor YlaD